MENAELRSLLLRESAALTPWESHGYFLTDDHAPVEKLGMAVIDALIQEELAYYKGVLREQGIKGLIAEVQGAAN